MHTICPISGITFPTPQFQGLNSTSEHPIFQIETEKLLFLSQKWITGGLNQQESKLLFLALLKSTGLVTFRCPGNPDNITITTNMPALLSLVQWKANVFTFRHDEQGFPLPRYVVSYNNSDMKSIKNYLKEWQEVRNNERSIWADRVKSRMDSEARAKARLAEEKLNKLLFSSLKRAKNYEYLLGKWALMCADVPESDPFYKEWLSYFSIKEPEIYNIPVWRIRDLKEHLEENLQHQVKVGNLGLAREALVHIRNLHTIATKGPAAYYGLDDISFTQAPMAIVQLRESVKNAPLTEPKETDYSSKVKYLVAKAAWGRRLHLQQLEAEHSNAIKLQFQAQQLSTSIQQEDAEYETINPEDLGVSSPRDNTFRELDPEFDLGL